MAVNLCKEEEKSIIPTQKKQQQLFILTTLVRNIIRRNGHRTQTKENKMNVTIYTEYQNQNGQKKEPTATPKMQFKKSEAILLAKSSK